MTTTDSNGLIQYQTTDNVVPLQTTLNAISSSVSTSLNSTVRTFKVANDTERNALATTRVPSATNPLVVFNSASGKGYHEINTGSGWSRLIPANLVHASSGNTLIQTGSATIYSGNSAPGTAGSIGITFPTAYSSAPNVFVQMTDARLTSDCSATTTSGATIGFRNNSNATANGPITARWMAIGQVAS